MIMKVKDFTIEPLLCPIGMKDCSPCRHAGQFTVKNPPIGNNDLGQHECHYFEWYEQQYSKAKKNFIV